MYLPLGGEFWGVVRLLREDREQVREESELLLDDVEQQIEGDESMSGLQLEDRSVDEKEYCFKLERYVEDPVQFDGVEGLAPSGGYFCGDDAILSCDSYGGES